MSVLNKINKDNFTNDFGVLLNESYIKLLDTNCVNFKIGYSLILLVIIYLSWILYWTFMLSCTNHSLYMYKPDINT